MTPSLKSKVFMLALPLFFPMTAQAGFLMTTNGDNAQIETSVVEDTMPMGNNEIPMNLVPMPSIDEQIPAQQVYIKRGEQVRKISPSADEAFNSKALLDAIEKGEAISFQSKGQGHKDGALIINPYPLENQANHVQDDQLSSLDQAMMEQTGLLRPAMAPGRIQPKQRVSNNNDEIQNTSLDKIDAVELAPIAVQQNPPVHIDGRASMMMKKNINPEPLKESTQRLSPLAPSQNPSTNENFPDAAGFGRDLPLALALSQVVPADYSYVFDGAVDTGAVVTWQGGKPWNLVLDDMLSQAGMRAVIQNNQVIVQNKNS